MECDVILCNPLCQLGCKCTKVINVYSFFWWLKNVNQQCYTQTSNITFGFSITCCTFMKFSRGNLIWYKKENINLMSFSHLFSIKWLTSKRKARSRCLPCRHNTLIAITVPSMRIPLYTTPYPPLSNIFASLKLSVAKSISFKVNTWTPLDLYWGMRPKLVLHRHPLFISAAFSKVPQNNCTCFGTNLKGIIHYYICTWTSIDVYGGMSNTE